MTHLCDVGVKIWASCTLGKHCTNWATSLAPKVCVCVCILYIVHHILGGVTYLTLLATRHPLSCENRRPHVSAPQGKRRIWGSTAENEACAEVRHWGMFSHGNRRNGAILWKQFRGPHALTPQLLKRNRKCLHSSYLALEWGIERTRSGRGGCTSAEGTARERNFHLRVSPDWVLLWHLGLDQHLGTSDWDLLDECIMAFLLLKVDSTSQESRDQPLPCLPGCILPEGKGAKTENGAVASL